MRLAFQFAFAVSLYLWVSNNSNAQGLQENAEQRSDQQLIDRADIVSNLYESLFTRIRASAVLPVHIGYRQPLFISVKELVKRMDAEDWDKPTRNALSAFLDNLYLDTRAGLFFLDAEALARVTRRPEEYRRRISRKSPMDAWGDDIPKYIGDEGAKQFAERRLALEGALSQLSRDEQKGLWLKFAGHVYLRNETRSQADLERIKSLAEKILRDAAGLSTDEQLEAVKLDIAWDKESSIRRSNEARFGANQHFTKLLSEASVGEIFQSSMRRPASKDSISRIRNDLLRVVARIKSSLETDPMHRLNGVQLVVSEIPQVLSGHPLDHLWLKATLSDNSPKVVASGPAILLAYGVCSARSYQISAWNFRGLLAGSNVREASDTPYDRVLEFLRSGSTRRTKSETTMVIARIHEEPDAERNRIAHTTVLSEVDNPMPRIDDVQDARRLSRQILDGFDDCVLRYVGFPLAHELAHIYLSDNPLRLMIDHTRADCEAIRVLRKVQIIKKFTSESVPTGGFMTHLFEQVLEIEDALTFTPQLRLDLDKRRAAIQLSQC